MVSSLIKEKFNFFNKNKTHLGWCDFQTIYQHEINRVHSKATFVEIGTYHGQSAKFMADQIQASGKDIDFYTIDNAKEAEDSLTEVNIPTGGAFDLQNNKFVKMIHSDSAEASKLFADNSLDFVFLDGSHVNPKFEQDLISWDSKIKIGGVIAGHDYLEFEDVYHTVNKMYGEENILTIMPGSWYIRK